MSSPLGPRMAWFLALVLAGSWVSLSPNWGGAKSQKTPPGGDFLQEWIGGWVILHGHADRLYRADFTDRLQHDAEIVGSTWDERRAFPMAYPPFHYALAAPLAALPIRFAAWIWLTLMMGCLVAATQYFPSFLASQQKGLMCAAWWLPIALIYPPAVESLTTNQKSTLCLLIFVATWWLIDRDRKLAAGLTFGLIVFKPHFAMVLLVAMLVRGEWRFLAGFATTLSGMIIISLAVSLQATTQFLKFAAGAMSYVNVSGYDVHESHCLRAFFEPWLRPETATVFTVVASLIVLAAAIGSARSWRIGDRSFRQGFAVIVIATVLISPHLYSYDLTLVLIPIGTFIRPVPGQPARCGTDDHVGLGRHAIFVFADLRDDREADRSADFCIVAAGFADYVSHLEPKRIHHGPGSHTCRSWRRGPVKTLWLPAVAGSGGRLRSCS